MASLFNYIYNQKGQPMPGTTAILHKNYFLLVRQWAAVAAAVYYPLYNIIDGYKRYT